MGSPAVANGVKVNLDGVFQLFERAVSHQLKWPKIRLQTRSGQVVVLKRAGQMSKYCGQIMITDDRPFGNNTYFGRIQENGEMFGTDAMTGEVVELLRRFSVDPAGVASEYGRRTGNCCFCQTPLTDDRSTTMGYGPVCAKHFGMPWGKDKETFQQVAVKMTASRPEFAAEFGGEGVS